MDLGVIPHDIASNIVWKYLPADGIIRYCRLNRSLQSLCNSPDTWRYLLYRDFTIVNPESNTREQYEFEKGLEENYNALFTISFSDMDNMIKSYGENVWNIFIQELDKYKQYIYSKSNHPPIGTPAYFEYIRILSGSGTFKYVIRGFYKRFLRERIREILFPASYIE